MPAVQFAEFLTRAASSSSPAASKFSNSLLGDYFFAPELNLLKLPRLEFADAIMNCLLSASAVSSLPSLSKTDSNDPMLSVNETSSKNSKIISFQTVQRLAACLPNSQLALASANPVLIERVCRVLSAILHSAAHHCCIGSAELSAYIQCIPVEALRCYSEWRLSCEDRSHSRLITALLELLSAVHMLNEKNVVGISVSELGSPASATVVGELSANEDRVAAQADPVSEKGFDLFGGQSDDAGEDGEGDVLNEEDPADLLHSIHFECNICHVKTSTEIKMLQHAMESQHIDYEQKQGSQAISEVVRASHQASENAAQEAPTLASATSLLDSLPASTIEEASLASLPQQRAIPLVVEWIAASGNDLELRWVSGRKDPLVTQNCTSLSETEFILEISADSLFITESPKQWKRVYQGPSLIWISSVHSPTLKLLPLGHYAFRVLQVGQNDLIAASATLNVSMPPDQRWNDTDARSLGCVVYDNGLSVRRDIIATSRIEQEKSNRISQKHVCVTMRSAFKPRACAPAGLKYRVADAFSWTIRIGNVQSGSCSIGVLHKNSKKQFDGKSDSDGALSSFKDTGFGSGDTVTFTLTFQGDNDRDQNVKIPQATLSAIKNGVDLGVVKFNLQLQSRDDCFIPFVSFKEAEDFVSLVPARPLLVGQRCIDRMSHARQLMESYDSAAGVSLPLLELGYSTYLMKAASACLMEIGGTQVNVSATACAAVVTPAYPVGLLVGQLVSIAGHGDAEVVGTCSDQVLLRRSLSPLSDSYLTVNKTALLSKTPEEIAQSLLKMVQAGQSLMDLAAVAHTGLFRSSGAFLNLSASSLPESAASHESKSSAELESKALSPEVTDVILEPKSAPPGAERLRLPEFLLQTIQATVQKVLAAEASWKKANEEATLVSTQLSEVKEWSYFFLCFKFLYFLLAKISFSSQQSSYKTERRERERYGCALSVSGDTISLKYLGLSKDSVSISAHKLIF